MGVFFSAGWSPCVGPVLGAILTLALNGGSISSGVVQGLGSSSVFVPLTTMAFATLPARYRNEAAALGTMMRNIGGSAGIAIVQAMTVRNSAVVQSRLVEAVRPDNPTLAMSMPGIDWNSAATLSGLQQDIIRQATMVSYIDAFWALFVLGMVAAPFVFLLRRPQLTGRDTDMPMVDVH